MHLPRKIQYIIQYIKKIFWYLIYSISDTFIRKTKIPFVSIVFCLLAIILSAINYNKGKNSNNNQHYNKDTKMWYYDEDYLQNKILETPSTEKNPNPENILLLLYDSLGISGFLYWTPIEFFFKIWMFTLVGLIECMFGHIGAIIFLFYTYLVQISAHTFLNVLCYNDYKNAYDLNRQAYCCGSVIFCVSFAFCLCILIPNVSYYYKIALLIIIGILYISFWLDDLSQYFFNHASSYICGSFLWHVYFLSMGVLLAIVVYNLENN